MQRLPIKTRYSDHELPVLIWEIFSDKDAYEELYVRLLCGRAPLNAYIYQHMGKTKFFSSTEAATLILSRPAIELARNLVGDSEFSKICYGYLISEYANNYSSDAQTEMLERCAVYLALKQSPHSSPENNPDLFLNSILQITSKPSSLSISRIMGLGQNAFGEFLTSIFNMYYYLMQQHAASSPNQLKEQMDFIDILKVITDRHVTTCAEFSKYLHSTEPMFNTNLFGMFSARPNYLKVRDQILGNTPRFDFDALSLAAGTFLNAIQTAQVDNPFVSRLKLLITDPELVDAPKDATQVGTELKPMRK